MWPNGQISLTIKKIPVNSRKISVRDEEDLTERCRVTPIVPQLSNQAPSSDTQIENVRPQTDPDPGDNVDINRFSSNSSRQNSSNRSIVDPSQFNPSDFVITGSGRISRPVLGKRLIDNIAK